MEMALVQVALVMPNGSLNFVDKSFTPNFKFE